ncbi:MULTISPECIES: sodium-dependent transporter [Anaerotruncus]|mgnify:FL=1|uniref:sodium-dependent transporter n=1 Tax=Anaerotruncus TaxID=244127 RepID=UPI000C7638F3|nr:sodium-dependent transporter [Anaerotruncus massiliensis (ex Togo et al. 2019)]MCQ4894541.1 sodium-dependent transporter [Anaerotruncus sp. DFI.9.16]GKH46988.1 sodium-dependent transporter [Oscillospiraceae bacterium]
MQREKFSSRLGFLLISAGCAIGIGNVWRFPYITGQYGGAAFVLIYLFFLVILGLPIMVMEFSVGRASQKSAARSFDVLEPKGSKWHLYKYGAMLGNYMLMMFYTTVGGWMLIYFVKMAGGEFVGKTPEEVGGIFNGMLGDPLLMMIWMVIVVVIGFSVCSMGLQNGVEKITKAMMSCLLLIMVVLVVRSVTLPGAGEGLRFYLMPDFGKMADQGITTVVSAAMGQAFFTLSLGIGAMAIFGSYIGKDRSLTGESISITLLDTFVALMAGLIIFPACSAFGVDSAQGPGLVFVTLPNIFNEMPGGRVFGALFFVFMSFAALSTIIAVFENIVSFGMDLWGWTRKKTVAVNFVAIILLSIPCVLGYNLWSGFVPLGAGSAVLDLEDFIVSNNLLPLGSLVYLLFCTSRYGWGWKNFLTEADTGNGVKFPKWSRIYVSYILPIIVLILFVQGYWDKIFKALFMR